MSRNGVNVCPEAWFLERCGITQNTAGERRMDAGSRAHRQIGHDTERIVHVERVRRVLLVAIVVLGVALLLSAAGGFTVARP